MSRRRRSNPILRRCEVRPSFRRVADSARPGACPRLPAPSDRREALVVAHQPGPAPCASSTASRLGRRTPSSGSQRPGARAPPVLTPEEITRLSGSGRRLAQPCRADDGLCGGAAGRRGCAPEGPRDRQHADVDPRASRMAACSSQILPSILAVAQNFAHDAAQIVPVRRCGLADQRIASDLIRE